MPTWSQASWTIAYAVRLDHAGGYEMLLVLLVGLLLMLALPALSVVGALGLGLTTVAVATNFWLFMSFSLALTLLTLACGKSGQA